MISSGTILIEKDTVRPRCFQLEADPYPNDWMSVKHNLTSYELEQELATEGWTFFYMAHEISASGFGLNRAKAIHAAVKRLITNVKHQRCNCLEIDEVSTRSFLGMSHVNVCAHVRHIQKGLVLHMDRIEGYKK